jgi:hypothetical protein
LNILLLLVVAAQVEWKRYMVEAIGAVEGVEQVDSVLLLDFL